MTDFIENAGQIPDFLKKHVTWKKLEYSQNTHSLTVRVPILTSIQCEQLAIHIKTNSRQFLKKQTTEYIIDLIDEVINRFLNRDEPIRRKAEQLMPLITGFDPEMSRLCLTRYLKTFRKSQLLRFVSEDFSNPKILDEFQPIIKGGFAKAYGPDSLLHIWSGNVPGLPIWSLVSGILVKAGNIGKISSSEPLFASLFAKLLIEIEPKFADCLSLLWWEGGTLDQENSLLKSSDVVLAYGSNDTIKQIRDRTPIKTRFLPHGHKISFGIVSARVLDPQKAWSLAHNAATDIIQYDQQGCYSPQIYFVEAGANINPKMFAKYIAHELSCFQKRFPRRVLNTEESIQLAAWQNNQEMELISDMRKEIIRDKSGAWAVIFSDNRKHFNVSGLNRTITVIEINSLDQIIPMISPHKEFLQTVGLAVAPDELFTISKKLGEHGVTRITSLGSMTAPEAGWHHDGRFNLSDLVTITEIESTLEEYSDMFANYTD